MNSIFEWMLMHIKTEGPKGCDFISADRSWSLRQIPMKKPNDRKIRGFTPREDPVEVFW
jgi:hypothetical protein